MDAGAQTRRLQSTQGTSRGLTEAPCASGHVAQEVQHEEQKHSLGRERRWACEKPKSPTRSPPFPASPQALARSPCPILLRPVVWCEPQTLNRTILTQSGKDGDGRKHRDGGAQRRP